MWIKSSKNDILGSTIPSMFDMIWQQMPETEFIIIIIIIDAAAKWPRFLIT